MARKSPFNFIEVRYVFGPEEGDQHLFIDGLQDVGSVGRSMCGMTAQEIHSTNNLPDVTESKQRDPERPVCVTCTKKWKTHPRSPWRMWSTTAKKAHA